MTGLLPTQMTSEPEHADSPTSLWGRWLLEGFLIALAVVLVLACLRAFVLERFTEESDGMGPRLPKGVSVFVVKIGAPQRGEVIVFKDPGGWAETKPRPSGLRMLAEALGLAPTTYPRPLMLRVVGLSGDEVRCCDLFGRIIVNGTAIEEPYASGEKLVGDQWRVVVPKDHYFVLADERDRGRDSRCHLRNSGGVSPFVQQREVVGTARFSLGKAELGGSEAFKGVTKPGIAPAEGTTHIEGEMPC